MPCCLLPYREQMTLGCVWSCEHQISPPTFTNIAAQKYHTELWCQCCESFVFRGRAVVRSPRRLLIGQDRACSPACELSRMLARLRVIAHVRLPTSYRACSPAYELAHQAPVTCEAKRTERQSKQEMTMDNSNSFSVTACVCGLHDEQLCRNLSSSLSGR